MGDVAITFIVLSFIALGASSLTHVVGDTYLSRRCFGVSIILLVVALIAAIVHSFPLTPPGVG